MGKMKNSDYWKLRFEQLEAAQNRKALTARAEIERIYRQAEREIEGKITTWYQRLADNNGVSMAEARKLLSAAELREFKWDVRDYIKYGKENALTGGWTKELENASAKFHVSRFEALKIHIRHSLEAASGKQLGVTRDVLTDVFRSSYYHTAYELQKGFGIGWDIAGLDQGHIEKLLSKPWAADGKNFSERIWSSRQKLVSEIHGELTRNVMLGQDPRKAIDSIAKKMNTSKYNAGRLVMTEEAYFSSAAQRDCFEELGVEQYEIVATLDSHTSEVCRSLDGKHFPMKDFQPGVTAPPFHVNCRSTTVPYFEDDFGSAGKRAARGEDGKTYYVPADMTYPEWEKSFIAEGDKSGFREAGKETSDKRVTVADITEEWTKTKGGKGVVIEKQEYETGGTVYKADGKKVVLRPNSQERMVAEVLSRKYGKKVELVPQILYPQGIKTPDYLIDGKRFDLKSPTGKGKNLLYGLIAKQGKQSHNFIIDVTDCPLNMEELERQADDLYGSRRTGFLEQIVFMKNGEIVKVLERMEKSENRP